MHRITTKPDPALTVAPTPDASVTPTPSPERGLGWNIALAAWVVAFVVLVLYELWNFVFPLVRAMFR